MYLEIRLPCNILIIVADLLQIGFSAYSFLNIFLE